jgi:hypothetical protein
LSPPPYRGPTRGEGEVWIEGNSVRDCMNAMGSRFPGFGELVYDSDGQPADFVRFFVNGNQIDTETFDTQVEPNAEIKVLAAIAGG